MVNLFRLILRMSATASAAICAVLLVRLLLARAPKKYSYLLWAVVGFRLACPVSFHSAFSLFSLRRHPVIFPSVPTGAVTPNTTPLTPPPTVVPTTEPVLPVPAPSPAPAPAPAAGVDWLQILAMLWVVGIVLIAGYSLFREVQLRRHLSTATRLDANIYCSESVSSPFLLGILRPRIYLPYGLDQQTQRYVLAHEQCHLRRLDHLTRRLSFLLLTIHWFNPLCWLAFTLCGKDMELSCDEAVLRKTDISKTDYSATLLSFAVNRRMFAPAPLAFGETGVKTRIKNALRWKQPALWVTLLAAALTITVLAACGMNPAKHTTIPFADLMGFSGYVEEYSDTERIYWAKTETGVFPIARSFGLRQDEHIVDLNMDGSRELIYTQSSKNGKPKTGVYSLDVPSGLILHADVSDFTENLPDLASGTPAHVWSTYELSTRQFRLQYEKEDGTEGQQTCTFDQLHFTPFAADVPLHIAPGTAITLKDAIPYAVVKNRTWQPVYIPLSDTPVKAPAEWAQQDFAGRKEAEFLSGTPAVQGQFLSDTTGWLTVTYGAGVAHADTYLYRTTDGGESWAQKATPPIHWHPGPIRFLNQECAVVTQRLFLDAPACLTRNGAKSWEPIPLPTPTAQVDQITWNGAELCLVVSDGQAQWVLRSSDLGRNWTTEENPNFSAAGYQELQTALHSLSQGTWGSLPCTVFLDNQELPLHYFSLPASRLVPTGPLLVSADRAPAPSSCFSIHWNDSSAVLSYSASDTPGIIEIQYQSGELRQTAEAQDLELYIWLLATAELPATELADIDADGFCESYFYGPTLQLYDYYDGQVQTPTLPDRNAMFIKGVLGGIMLNPNRQYQLMMDCGEEVGLFSYRDGKTTFLCTLREAYREDLQSGDYEACMEELQSSSSTYGPEDMEFTDLALNSAPDALTYEERLAWITTPPETDESMPRIPTGDYVESGSALAYLSLQAGASHTRQHVLTIRFPDGTAADLPLPNNTPTSVSPPDRMFFDGNHFFYDATFYNTLNFGSVIDPIHFEGTYHYNVDLNAKTVSLQVEQ